jgi:putative hemolysin
MRYYKQSAREISYAYSAQSFSGRALIKILENVTGRVSLIKKAKDYELEIASGASFWEVMFQRYGLSLEILDGAFSNIPKNGPLIIIANHPFGILDGLILGYIMSKVRKNFKILAHKVFCKSAELDDVILPISFDETKEAAQLNIQTRVSALNFLNSGGAVGIFPGGTVSTALAPFGVPMDPSWRSFTAKMITKSGAQVVPVFFEGNNSLTFQLASHIHYNLRLGLLIKEFKSKVGNPVKICIGKPLSNSEIKSRSGNLRILMDFLRKETYKLSQKPMENFDYGFEFESRYKL